VKRVMFDSDVILDVFLQRQPYFSDSALALDLVGQGRVQGFVSGHAITNLFYLMRKQLGSERSRALLSVLLTKVRVAAVTEAVIRAALSSPIADFKDAVAVAAAQAEEIEVIVTRNTKDFRQSAISARLPGDLLNEFGDR
jgi:predicted nucleic acid-binding protein